MELKGLPAGLYEVQIEASDVFGFTDQSTVEYQREACITEIHNVVSCTEEQLCMQLIICCTSSIVQYSTTVLVTFTK